MLDVQDPRFIFSPNVQVASHKKPASAEIYHDSCGAQDSDERDAKCNSPLQICIQKYHFASSLK
jgi:hypothetical protein